MNILLLCGSLSYAGAQRQLFELAVGLNKKHHVLVCSISDKVPLLNEFKKSNIKVEVLSLRKRNFSKIINRLQHQIDEHHIEVVYSFLETANTYSRVMKLFNPKLKVISSERSSDTVLDFKSKLIEKGLSKLTDLYIANSYAGKSALIKHHKLKNIEVIHNGIDLTRFSSVGKSSLDMDLTGKVVISQIGRIKPDKNYEMFLEVAERVCNLHHQVIFLAVGDQPDSMDKYQKTILNRQKKLKNNNRILFIGKRSDIPEILSETDISILTSHREGCSNTVLESMFARCPLVVTDVGDNRIMLSKANQDFIVNPDDVVAMVNKLSVLIEDSGLRQQIGNQNYEKAQNEFTNKTMVENTESLILSLLQS